jgi:hypothetical protein
MTAVHGEGPPSRRSALIGSGLIVVSRERRSAVWGCLPPATTAVARRRRARPPDGRRHDLAGYYPAAPDTG